MINQGNPYDLAVWAARAKYPIGGHVTDEQAEQLAHIAARYAAQAVSLMIVEELNNRRYHRASWIADEIGKVFAPDEVGE